MVNGYFLDSGLWSFLTRSELYLLLYSSNEAKHIYAAINKQHISEVKHGDVAYVDLRWYGYDGYSGLGLPNYDTHKYVVAFSYTQWLHSKTHTKIVAVCRVFNEKWPLNHYIFRAYGSCLNLTDSVTLVGNKFVALYPRLDLPLILKRALSYSSCGLCVTAFKTQRGG